MRALSTRVASPVLASDLPGAHPLRIEGRLVVIVGRVRAVSVHGQVEEPLRREGSRIAPVHTARGSCRRRAPAASLGGARGRAGVAVAVAVVIEENDGAARAAAVETPPRRRESVVVVVVVNKIDGLLPRRPGRRARL